MNAAMIPYIFYLAGSISFVVGTIIAMYQQWGGA